MKKETVDYIIKDMPKDFHTDVKIKAAEEGTTMKEIIYKSLREYLAKF